ncbi:universal stress protein [Saccharopolyspora taberi]|uniref:Universal stress protein n=1 Tax=Saccharopolyspora taberi TaxID=60895 RepID=A0ABN3VER7_9PSEU
MVAPDKPVAAGVDGSEGSGRAALWAAAEAARRGAGLRLVIVNDDPVRADHAEQAVHEIATKCRAHAPDVEVTAEVVTGRPVEELLRLSGAAQLVVLGARGRGGFTQALLGGVSTGVATQASCPVVVVRRDVPETAGPVVVGVDDSACSREALRFAYAAAARLGADLVALEAWHEEGLLAVPLAPPDRDRVQHEVEQSLAKQTAPLRERYPAVRTREVVQRGHAVSALTDAARDARLLVVGHRGSGGFDSLFLGSVAAGVLHHAPCPVAVVRGAG